MKYDFEIPPDQNVFICGMTGSGKTVLAEVYLAGYDNVIKVDTKQEYMSRQKKGEPAWRGLVEGEDFTVCHSLKEVMDSEWSKIIYIVPWDEQNPENYNELCKYCFMEGDWILWVDEMMSFFESAQTNIKFCKAIYTAGRTRGVVIWGCTQRPASIPAYCISNSYHFFTYTMTNPADRKRMVDITGCPELMKKPKKFVFWYFREGMDEAQVTKGRLKL